MTNKDQSSNSIGLFDSGIGGLTVMQQLLKVLPEEHFIYFGDTARLPYGDKSSETIIRYSLENAEFLLEKKIKLLVVACNTASAYAIDHLQQRLSIPVIGVVEPGADSAVQASRTGRIAVLGTRATVQSQAYQKAISMRDPGAVVIPLACPLFVPLVEEHFMDHPATRMIVEQYLKPLKEQRVDTVLLGCTHYPLLKDTIRHVMGNDVAIVDSALSCAETVKALLHEQGLKAPKKTHEEHHYYVSDDPRKFQILGESFLGMPLAQVRKVDLAFDRKI